MATSDKIAVNWNLKNVDKNEVFRPQFPIGDDGVNIEISSSIAEQQRFGFQDALLAFTNGNTRTISFQTRLFARHREEDIDTQLNTLERMATKDETLGRLPVCLFTYGKRTSIFVLIESAAQNIRRVQRDGSTQDVVINLSLKKYVPYSKSQVDPSKPAKESFYLVTKESEKSYEAIAKRFYGNPLFGDRLRKRHPGSPLAPNVGDTVRVPSRNIILAEEVLPESFILSLTDVDAVENYERILAARNERKLVVVD